MKTTTTTPEEVELISGNLQKRIREVGVSYAELAQLTGISKSVIHRYAIGRIQKMQYAKLEAIAIELGTSLEELGVQGLPEKGSNDGNDKRNEGNDKCSNRETSSETDVLPLFGDPVVISVISIIFSLTAIALTLAKVLLK